MGTKVIKGPAAIQIKAPAKVTGQETKHDAKSGLTTMTIRYEDGTNISITTGGKNIEVHCNRSVVIDEDAKGVRTVRIIKN